MPGDDDTEEEEEVVEVPTVEALLTSDADMLNDIVTIFQDAREVAMAATKAEARYLIMQDNSTSSIAKSSLTSATMAAYSVACAYTSGD